MQIENNPKTGTLRIFDIQEDEMESMLEFIRELYLSGKIVTIKNEEK